MQTKQQAPKHQGMSSTFCPMTYSPSPNTVRSFGKDVHISYLPYAAGYDCDTTSIVLRDHVYLTLNGDHADALIAATVEAGVQGCVDYFVGHLDQANKLSEHLMAVGLKDDRFNLAPTTIAIFGQDSVDCIAAAARALQAVDAAAAEGAAVDGHVHPQA